MSYLPQSHQDPARVGVPSGAMPLATAESRVLSDTDFAAPVEDRWFEDYLPGSVYEFGHVGVSEEDIVAFAQLYDRQAIHTDPGWAATGPFRGLIASGIQTIALCMRALRRPLRLPSCGPGSTGHRGGALAASREAR